ncbi:uncharacterized protein LOC123586641 [Leopardus geoffroyi]|uniref:uncharacterized protein LOC123586641 n=1 Tax=Leopardus geoffroyi TaxID=46844 RepID=UPI001E26517D|nr:uncharacterized protein LOC123586641 [Leopardus geoffroyi]
MGSFITILTTPSSSFSKVNHHATRLGLSPPPTRIFGRGFGSYEMTYLASIHQCGHQKNGQDDPPRSPDVPISHHLPEGKQTGPRHSPPRAAGAPRLPGKGATRVPSTARTAAPFQVAWRTWRRCPRLGRGRRAGVRAARALARGSGPRRRRRRRRRPLRGSPGSHRRPPAPGGAAAPGSRPLPGSQRVRFSFTTKSLPVTATGLEAKAAGQPGQGPERSRRGRRGKKIQPTSLDQDLLVIISWRRLDHMEQPRVKPTLQVNSRNSHPQSDTMTSMEAKGTMRLPALCANGIGLPVRLGAGGCETMYKIKCEREMLIKSFGKRCLLFKKYCERGCKDQCCAYQIKVEEGR